MADEQLDDNPLMSEQWIAKTDFAFGVDLKSHPPVMRYQLLQGRLFTLQLFPSGSIARGEISPGDVGFPLAAGEGWYNGDGEFLGDDPSVPKWD